MVTVKDIENFKKKCLSFEKKVHESYSSIASEIRDVIRECNDEILRDELMELGYNNVEKANIHSADYFTIGHSVHYHKNMILWSDGCSVPWLDDPSETCQSGKYYVKISFSTGAYYIVGNNNHSNDNYRKAQPLMREMWTEIMAYGPDVSDTHNLSAYFEIHSSSAVKIWNEIDGIVTKYRDKVSEMLENDKEAQIASLQAQIDKLKNS